MKSALAALLVVLLVSVSMGWQPLSQPEPLSQEQKELLKERDRLREESRRWRADDLDKAVAPAEKALAIERKVLGDADDAVAVSMRALAALHTERDDFSSARSVLQEIVLIQKKRFGDNDWRFANAQFAVAWVEREARMTADDRAQLREGVELFRKASALRTGGKIKEAVEPAEKAMALLQRFAGEKEPLYASSIGLLGFLCSAQKDYVRAEPLLRQGLELRKQVLGEWHPSYAFSLDNLSRMYFQQAKYSEVAPMIRQVAEIYKKAFGEKSPRYTLALTNLGLVYLRLKDYAAAEPLFQQSLEIRKQSLGDKHLDYARSLSNLAALYRARGEEARADPLVRQAKTITTEWYLKKRQDYHDRALAHYEQGRYVEAARLALLAQTSDREYWKPDNWTSVPDDERKAVLARLQPISAQAVNIQGLVYLAEGNYGHAQLSFAKRPNNATYLTNMAKLYLVQRDYASAEPLFKQALEIRKEALGTQHPDYAESLNSLSMYWTTQGDYARAEALCQQALRISKEAVGEEDRHYVACLQQLARLYQAREEYAKAEPLFRKVAAISRKTLGELHPDYAACLNDLAGVLQAQGDFDRAEPLFKQALQVTRAWQLHEVETLNKNLEAWEEHGDESFASLQRRIHKGVLQEKHPHYVACLNNLARLYQANGDYDQAEAFFTQVLKIHQLSKTGNAHEQALRMKYQGVSDYAQSMKNLAGLYLARGKYGNTIRQPVIPVQTLELAKADYEKARILYLRVMAANAQSQDWKKRLKVNLEGVKGAEQAAGFDKKTGFPTTARVFNASDFRPLPDNVTLFADYGLLLEKRLFAKPREDQLRGCDHAYGLCLALLDRMRDEVLEHEASKLQHGAGLFDVIPRRLGICQRLFQLEGKSGGKVEYLDNAFSTVEQGRARVFLEALGRSRANLLGGVSPEMNAREAALVDKLRSYDAQIAEEWSKLSEKETKAAQEPLALRKLRSEQGKAEKQLQELIGEMEKTYPQYAALKHPKPCTVEQARDCLADNEVALLYVLGKEISYLLLLESRAAAKDPARALAIYSLPGGAEIGDLVSVLTDPETLALPARARTLGRDGYAQLLRPVADRIKGKDLVIVPGESLCYLPFELLIEDGKYLIENHRIRYAPSMTALHLMRLWQDKRSKQPDQGLWAIGDPVYDVRDSRLAGPGAMASASQDAVKNYQISVGREGEAAFPRLIHTAREVDDIGKLLNAPADHVRTGARALESAVKAASVSGQLARHRYVHFATHGILGVAEGQPPALVLSLVGENGERDATGVNDGFLRLGEVTHLKLNADLVVLSACRTGQGKLSRGEGVSGLARAFLYAGSRGVVCSLWSVDDQQTANLMTDMYARLTKGDAAADALRQAKLELIRADRAPLYWAPFILIGE